RMKRDFECLSIDYNNFTPGEPVIRVLEELAGVRDATEANIFFYHSDHLGSSSFLTDGGGIATQHLQYMPFGEDLVHQQNTAAYYTPYTFSGKERDMETGLSYFGARYYDAGLSIWLSVDPLTERYPNLTPYQYCKNNPIIYVDPNGLTDYEFDKKSGKLILIEGTENDGPDRIIKNAKYDSNKNLKNKSGVLQLEGKVEDYKDGFGKDDKGEFQFQTYTFSNEKDADNAYKFMANSTNVEIGKWQMESGSGKQYTRFYTSGDKDKIRGEFLFMISLKDLEPGLKLISHIHNHGNLSADYIGTFGPSGNDQVFSRRVSEDIFMDQTTPPSFYVWRFGTKTPYDKDGPIKKKR
ncbi:MAG: RHS repeat-associated core domain-containing protein, partial [Sphingobacteriaceae bacterium]|nr:RHS repeat-associated core domain-containing protein [Sphingobacteriaceae bacterium]